MEPLLITLPPELFAPAAMRTFTGEIPSLELRAGADDYDFDGPLAWSVTFTNTGDALLATGTVEGRATTACGRCLEPVDLELSGEGEGFYLLDDAAAPDDLEADEYEVLNPDHVVDIAPLLTSALLLELPLVPLCQPECRGLCPQCGANLNERPCQCESDASSEEPLADNPFSVLKDFPFED